MNIKCKCRKWEAYQLCQEKLSPKRTLNCLTSNQRRSVSVTAQSPNAAPPFREPSYRHWQLAPEHRTCRAIPEHWHRGDQPLEAVGCRAKRNALFKSCALDRTFVIPTLHLLLDGILGKTVEEFLPYPQRGSQQRTNFLQPCSHVSANEPD